MLGNSLYEILLTKLINSFTYEFWVKPDSVHRIDKQSREKPINADGKNYIVGPGNGEFYDEAGISVSVGKNGVIVLEHTEINTFAVLVHETEINDIIHIAIVYDNGYPYLYINGEFVKIGERSPKRYVYPTGIIGSLSGGSFKGEIKEIRLWDHCRTKKQLKTYINQQISINKEGLYGIWPDRPVKETDVRVKQKNSQTTKKTSKANRENNKNQNIEVSIIIPSYNKFPLNIFTLYSLEQQTFNPSKIEVIFIDDASTDQTEEKLKGYNPPYHFKYIRNNSNLGRAKVRNIGIQAAKGSILIFLDAEMITEPDFVEKHIKSHQSQNKVILSGVMHSKKIYSCIFPEFPQDVMNRIEALTKNNPEKNRKLQDLKLPYEKPYPLIEKDDITNKTYTDLVFKPFTWFETIVKNFDVDLDGFMFPWMAFLTGNVSIRKEFIQQAGLFDEDFVQYGYEDWEIGYRLYKLGAKYIVSNDLITYHQEHPVGISKWKEAINNLGLFILKHHDVDVLILGLELAGIVNLLTMNKVLREYKLLVQTYAERFQEFQERFIRILQATVLLLQIDVRHINILGAAGFGSDERKGIQEDINSLKSLGEFTNLTSLLEKILNS
ncbi:glycosyltransferase [Neobacillus sp. NRS-1170]|uniref:glycosyltransferase n=1 Tax=Neobacillus sp. NRS-1170 TaxID=3233898 RepID=UPI003D2C0649